MDFRDPALTFAAICVFGFANAVFWYSWFGVVGKASQAILDEIAEVRSSVEMTNKWLVHIDDHLSYLRDKTRERENRAHGRAVLADYVKGVNERARQREKPNGED